MCRSYKVLPNVKNNTSHILLALPLFVSVYNPILKCRRKNPRGVALQFRWVLVCLIFICIKPFGGSGCKMFFLVQSLTFWVGWGKGVLSERERGEFKPVGLNQTSVWILGDELDAWKRRQFGLGKICAQKCMACCYHCEGTAPGDFPTVFPVQPDPWGFVWMQCEHYPWGGVRGV